jgi:hypothetical protein
VRTPYAPTRLLPARDCVQVGHPCTAFEYRHGVTELDSDSDLMVVRFVCLACADGCPAQAPTYFTSYQAAAVHVARSHRCRLSQKKIATVVLPNRPADNEAGGSGAAGAWTGQNQKQRRPRSDLARPCPSGSGTGPTYLMI